MNKINCGSLRLEHADQTVSLSGWINTIRDHGEMIFFDIRDIHGITQCIMKKDEVSEEMYELASSIRRESVVEITGIVTARPKGTENKKLATGAIEMKVSDVKILNHSEVLPYHFSDQEKTDEKVKLKYRYIDLRHPKLQEIIKLRSKASVVTRLFLDQQGFYEIETPMLTKSTPEGARDYLVPSRVHKGKFYALPQSPQLFKQLLMVSGFERYFQITRCFRDEDLRPERQPEFTQIDLEMSFVTQEDVLNLVEGLLKEIFKETIGVDIETPFKRYSYQEVMDRFGSDKPDTRFGLELIDITDHIPRTVSIFEKVFQNQGKIKAINVKGGASRYKKKRFSKIRRFVQEYKAKDLGSIHIREDSLKSPLSRFMEEKELQAIVDHMGGEPGDVILFIAGTPKIVTKALGELRVHIAKDMELIPKDTYDLLWVIDFPMFDWDEEEERWNAVHHPFTSCKPEYLETLESEPEKALANAYDVVCNGYELGGGSIRIHQPEVQQKIFDILSIPKEIAKQNFSFLVDALKYGAPPHGGLALGFDRLIMLLCGTNNIQDVIAFPKTRNARLLTGDAPGVVTERQLDELGIQLQPEIITLLEEKEKTRASQSKE